MSDYSFKDFLGECVIGGIVLVGVGLYSLCQPEKSEADKRADEWWANPKNREGKSPWFYNQDF